MTISRLKGIFRILVMLALVAWTLPARSQEVLVFASIDDTIEWLQQEDFWGEENRDKQLEVPRVLLTGINPRWRKAAQSMPVAHKKEIFYRFMLPMVVPREVCTAFSPKLALTTPVPAKEVSRVPSSRATLRAGWMTTR